MSAWLRRQGLALALAGRRIRQGWSSFLFNAVVIAAVLLLPFAGLTLLDNLLPLASRVATEPELTVFLKPGQPPHGGGAGDRLRKVAHENHPGAALEFVSREQALTYLKKRSSIGEAVAVLGENPLPDAWIVRLPAGQANMDKARLQSLADSLAKVEGVDRVQVDSEWITRLAALLRLLQLALAGLGMTLAVVVVAVVFNTVRLQVLTQREEIEVSRLCGASDAWVSRPFYYSGAMLGGASAALALAAIAAFLPWLNHAVAQLAGAYGSGFLLTPLSLSHAAALLAASLLLGALGAGLSVRRHLGRRQES